MEHFLGLFRDSSSVLFPRLFPWSDLWTPVPLLLVSHSSSSAHPSGGAHHCPSGGVSSCLWVIPFDSFYSNPGWAILALVHFWSMWNTHAPFAHATRYMLLLLLFSQCCSVSFLCSKATSHFFTSQIFCAQVRYQPMMFPMLWSCFLNLGAIDNSWLQGSVLCTVACLATSLTSTHLGPGASLSHTEPRHC